MNAAQSVCRFCVAVGADRARRLRFASKAPDFPLENDGGAPAEQKIGERVFVDTRFAEYFAAHMTDVNDPLAVGDPVVADGAEPPTGRCPGRLRGSRSTAARATSSWSFRAWPARGIARTRISPTHSPIPLPMGRFHATPRNSMQMVGSLHAAQRADIPALRRAVRRSRRSGEDHADRPQFRLGADANSASRRAHRESDSRRQRHERAGAGVRRESFVRDDFSGHAAGNSEGRAAAGAIPARRDHGDATIRS